MSLGNIATMKSKISELIYLTEYFGMDPGLSTVLCLL